jgi:tripartite-type tricarboxylate transporter receptor subunit TctC
MTVRQPLSRAPAIGVDFSESCQRDVPKSPGGKGNGDIVGGAKNPKIDLTLGRRTRSIARASFRIVVGGTMQFPRRQFFEIACTVVAIIIVGMSDYSAWCQTTRSIRLVIPYAAGGANEAMLRLIAEQIGRAGGPPFLIESRPGAGTVLATDAVSRAAPDGNTILLVGNSFVINPHVRKLAYDPLTSFEPICYLWQSPAIFAVNSASPYRTLADLLGAARAKPGALTMGASGPLTGFHIGFERFKQAANIEMTFVPFGGTVPAVNALLGEHVTSEFGDYSIVAEHLKAGKLRALAAASRTRIEPLPEVPTVAESGFNDYEADIWYGLVVPAKTAKEKIIELTYWMSGAMRDPEIRSKLVAVGLYPVSVCGTEFGTHIRKQYEDYGRVIRSSNIKAE